MPFSAIVGSRTCTKPGTPRHSPRGGRPHAARISGGARVALSFLFMAGCDRKPAPPPEPAKPAPSEAPVPNAAPPQSAAPTGAAQNAGPSGPATPAAPQQTAASRASDAEYKALELKMLDAYEKQDYTDAMRCVEAMLPMRPKEVILPYRKAILHFLLGQKDDGYLWLQKSVEAGFENVDALEGDVNLVAIRGEPRFKEIVHQLKAALGRTPEQRVWKVKLPEKLDPQRPAPLLVALHGFGGNAEEFQKVWSPAADRVGMILLTVQAPVPLDPGMFQWSGGGKDAEELILSAIESVKKQCRVDERRVVLTGFSEGGWMTYRMLVRAPKLFAGIIPMSGRCEPVIADLIAKQKLSGLRAYITVGAKDEVELPFNRRAAEVLRSAGATVQLHELPDLGHDLPADRDAELMKSLQFVLGATTGAGPQ